jgi:regulator of protease activity HflC (stomatin/prohibitin superfamily)
MRRWRCVVTIAVVVAAVVGLLVVLVLSALKVIPEYERAVFFRLGHLRRRKGVSPWSS